MPNPLDPVSLFRALHEHHVEYVLIGGLAAVLHGSTAVTNDADIFPDPNLDNLRHLGAALRSLDARIRTPEDPDGLAFEPHAELLASVTMLNMTTRCGDLVLAFSPVGLGSFAEVAGRALTFDIEGIPVSVAALADIIRSKESADRPKDRAVLPILYALEDELRRLE